MRQTAFYLLAAVIGSTVAHAQTTLVFRNGLNGYAGTIDTTISNGDPDHADGAAEIIGWSADSPAGSGEDGFALIRFDQLFGLGPNQIPPGAAITSATLKYWLEAGSTTGELREVLVDWDESTSAAAFGPAPGVQPSDFSARRYGAARGTSASQTVGVWESLVKWSDDPTLNRGWIIRPANSTTFGKLYSSEYAATPAQRVSLTVVVNNTGVPALVRAPYVQKVGEHTFTLKWRTDMKTNSVVRYGESPDALEDAVQLGGARRDHEVTIGGLTPDRTYYYSVGSSEHTIAGADVDHFVRTAPSKESSNLRTIWAFGDSGTDTIILRAMRDAMLAHIGGPPDAIIHVGDLAYLFGADGELTQGLFTPFAATLRHTPFWPAIGTHDELNSNSQLQTGVYYESFSLPKNGEGGGKPSHTEAYYSFDIGDAHFIALNSLGVSLIPGGAMQQWLAQDMAQTDANWIIAYFHDAPYSNGTHNADTDENMTAVRELLVPALEAHGVDLVVAGHSHGYERSFLLDGAYNTPVTADGHLVDSGDGDPTGDGAYRKPAGITPRSGAVYVVAGHAKSAHEVEPHPVMAAGENLAGSLLISIQENALTVENVRFDGVVSDTFRIVKSAAADLNGDGFVNGSDLAVLLTQWGPCADCDADFNSDGQINGTDLAALLTQWGA